MNIININNHPILINKNSKMTFNLKCQVHKMVNMLII